MHKQTLNTLIVLCGGHGLRIRKHFDDLPKPLIVIHNKPLLQYIIDWYVKHGVKKIILLVGNNENLYIEFSNNFQNDNIEILVLQTGLNTNTGGRIKKAESLLENLDSFFISYGDGIANINIEEQWKFHRAHGKIATLTAIKPVLPYGLLNINEHSNVDSFIEKPILNQYINGGYFICNKEVFKYLNENSDFEKEILYQLSQNSQLNAFIHKGFWKSMDTYKDYTELNDFDLEKKLTKK